MSQVDYRQDGFKTRGVFSSPYIWLQEKAKADQAIWKHSDNHWVVNNRIYDLSAFAKVHPGGSHWIELTKGQDVSELFQIHHLRREKAVQVLNKYQVGKCQNKFFRFSFQQGGLYRTIKDELLSKFTPQYLQDSSNTKLIALLFLAAYFLVLCTAGLYKSYLCGALCSLMLVGICGLGHNFMHQKVNPFRYLYQLTGLGHKQWQIFHAISHHPFPNTNIDYEIAVFQPLVHFLKYQRTNHPATVIAMQPFFMLMVPINMLIKNLTPLFRSQIKFNLDNLLPFLQLPLLYFAGAQRECLWIFIWIQSLFGYLFTLVVFCGHRNPNLWAEGDQRTQDFAMHTIISTNDHEVDWNPFMSLTFSSGFNVHIAHHLFPTVDFLRLRVVNKVIKSVCERKGVKISESSKLQCFSNYNKAVLQRKCMKQ